MKKNNERQIEIEFRSRFDEKKYKELQEFLNQKAEDLGADDKNVLFFIFPNKLFKVVDNVSQKTAKIVLKLNKIGRGSDFEEIEIFIDPKQVEKMLRIFQELNLNADLMESFQKRHNYRYKEVEIALKYSDHWGYHLELEILVSDLTKKDKAEQKIKEVADELNISLMSDKELQEFTHKAEEDYKKHQKKDELD